MIGSVVPVHRVILRSHAVSTPLVVDTGRVLSNIEVLQRSLVLVVTVILTTYDTEESRCKYAIGCMMYISGLPIALPMAVHYRESPGTGPVLLKVVRWTGASYSGNPVNQLACAYLVTATTAHTVDTCFKRRESWLVDMTCTFPFFV